MAQQRSSTVNSEAVVFFAMRRLCIARSQLLAALVTLGVAGTLISVASSKDDNLRPELVSLQRETGLSLAYFGWELFTVDFRDPKKLFSVEEIPTPVGGSQEGDLSPRGTMIAFAWRYPPDSQSRDAIFPFTSSRLGIARRDGSDVREFEQVKLPESFCWSPDESRLAVYSPYPRLNRWSGGKVYVITLASGIVEQITAGAALLTTQCWSADGHQLVYSLKGDDEEPSETITVYDTVEKKSRIMGRGTHPTWSADGQQVAFLVGDDYYTVPAGGGQQKLFLHAPKATTGLLWSPDSRYVAYGICCRYSSDTRLYRFYVRRLRDNAETWAHDVGDVPHGRDVHWVLPVARK